MLLWAIGALAAAAFTGSRGALAVALAAACAWSSTRALEVRDVPHLPFVLIWLLAGGLALAGIHAWRPIWSRLPRFPRGFPCRFSPRSKRPLCLPTAQPCCLALDSRLPP